MKRENLDKLIRAAGMLQGISWLVEEKCDCGVEAIWFILEDLEEVIQDESEDNKNDDR